MIARVTPVVSVVICLLAVGLWLLFIWLPPELQSHRGALSLWLAGLVIVTVIELSWALNTAIKRPLARLSNVLRDAVPDAQTRVPDDPFTAIKEQVNVLSQRLTISEANLISETKVRREAETARN
jgi:uncharacterized metal-binding protein